MLSPRTIPYSLLAAVLLTIPALASTTPRSPWIEVHSTHFTVITDAGDKRGRQIALRFEQMHAVFAGLLRKDRLTQAVPLTILAFNNDKDYYQLAPLKDGQPIDVPGFFLPCPDQYFIVLNLTEPHPWRAVAYDLARMYLNYNYPPAQGWFDVGLSEYFASIRLDDNTVELGSDPEAAISTPDVPQNQSTAPQSLTDLLGAQIWLSVPDLFTMKHDPWDFNEGTHHTLFYAQSWMFMHYLIHEQLLSETGTYLGLAMYQKLPIDEAIQKAYGLGPGQLETAVKTYFHSLGSLQSGAGAPSANANSANPNSAHPGIHSFPSPVGPDTSAIISKSLSEDDFHAIYADVQTRIPERREAGLKELQRLATTAVTQVTANPFRVAHPNDQQTLNTAIGNEIAHRALAWDDIQHSKFEDAFAELGDAASLNSGDLWIRFYLSVMKYRMSQANHGDIQGLANMMQDLRSVLEWYPEFADAYDLLAVARNYGGTPNPAMLAERAAIQLSPRNQLYLYHLAEIYISSKKWPAATSLLEQLKASDNTQVASDAKARLSEIASQQKYGIAANLGNSPKLEPQKSPFDVLDQDAAKRAAATQVSEESTTADKRVTKFLRGTLVQVDCSHAPAAILTVSGKGNTLSLHTADYKSLVLIGADQFSCDWQGRSVDVNYKSDGPNSGDIVSLEVH